jgi:two-component system CheB/CheR fusion protein
VTRLLDDLLDVSRITHGKFELRRGSVDLRGAAEQAISVVQSQIEEAELGFSAELCDRPLVVLGDPARLQQVIVNLLTNAIKYTEQGGDIYLGLQWEEGTAILKVRDSGAGIPEEKLGEIFQLFYQSDDTLDRSDGGMGVGLTLVKAVVELHGGSVDVESAGVGCGSQFSVRLPLIAEEDVAEEQLNTPVATPNIRSLVLVEDLDDAREMLASLLLLEGLEVYEAATGTDGLKLIQEVMPDAAIIDIGLPEMDGHSVARAIRSEPRFNNIRLVALTGYGQDSDRLAVTESGFDLHLVKPLDPQKLGDILSGLSRIQKVS